MYDKWDQKIHKNSAAAPAMKIASAPRLWQTSVLTLFSSICTS